MDRQRIKIMIVTCSQQTPVILVGNKEQQKKYLGRFLEEALVAVSMAVVPCITFFVYFNIGCCFVLPVVFFPSVFQKYISLSSDITTWLFV
jgi:hypothetical protein